MRDRSDLSEREYVLRETGKESLGEIVKFILVGDECEGNV